MVLWFPAQLAEAGCVRNRFDREMLLLVNSGD
jgi:hypothetical protein